MSVAMIIYDAAEVRKNWIITPVIVLVAISAVNLVKKPVFTALVKGPRGDLFSRDILAVRQKVKDRLGNYSADIPIDSSIFVIWNNTSGLPHYISTFELAPRRTNFECFSLGPRRFDGDVWSCDWTPEHLRAVLHDFNYDFIFIGSADDAFWNRYSSLFDVGARRADIPFFRVNNSGTKAFEAIEPTK